MPPWQEHLQLAQWIGAGRVGLAAYLFGCFTSGYYLVRYWTGQDIRAVGSGSVGARNVGRVLGRPGFFLTAIGDFAKGALVVWGARVFTHDDCLVAVSMLAVVVGHVWPFQLRLQGGKGMATSLGALCVYDFRLAATFAVLFVAGCLLLRKTLVPSLSALACLPFVAAFLGQDSFSVGYDPVKAISLWLLASVVLLAHRSNIMKEILCFSAGPNIRNDPPHL
jgi:acyl phosphate:glycerol-3-phosphate acyltransferase